MPQWLVVTQQQVADTASYRDVMMRVWYHSTQGVSDSSNSFSTSGDHTPNLSGVSVNINVPGSGGQGASQLIHERTTRITKQYGSSTSVYAAAWLSGIDYWGVGQEIYANHTYTVPARAFAAPNAPVNVSVSRNSDTSHTVSWERRATTAGRYQSQRVQRQTWADGSWGSWQTVHTISTNYTSNGSHSWTDTGTRANRTYRWRVQAVNSTATTTSGTTTALTTPETPVSVVASKLASGDIRVRINPAFTSNLVQFVIQHSTNGGSSWSALATIDGSREVTDYTHVGPSAGDTHRYRVQVRVNNSGVVGHGLTSGWRVSNIVELAAPPNAPSGLYALPYDALAHPADEDLLLDWEHRPNDGSWQEKFQLRHRLVGTSAWTTTPQIDTPGEVSGGLYTLPADTYANGDSMEWQVRTWGPHPDPSPWSATALVVFAAPPTVAISFPEAGGVVEDSTLTASWAYYHSGDSPQAAWRATLNGLTVDAHESRQGQGAAAQTTFDVPVQDGGEYELSVQVKNALGMWSDVDSVEFAVDYLPPALVDVTGLEWDRLSGTVAISLEPQSWDGETALEPVAVTVHRSVDGGESWQIVAREIPIGGGITTLVDATVPTRADVLYRVTSISALPSVATAVPVAISIDESQYAYLSYGAQFENVLVFYGNLTLTSQASRAQALEHFAGRSRGVIIAGQTRTRDVGVSVTMLKADGLAVGTDFEDAALHGGLMLYRDPSGRRMFGMMHGLSTASQWDAVGAGSFTISEAEDG